MMNRSSSFLTRVRPIVFLLVATLVALFGLYIVSGFWIPSEAGEITSLTGYWEISLNGEELDETRMEYTVIEPPERGDVYLCSTRLPAFSFAAPTLRVYSAHAILDCYLDDTLIYTYGASYLVRDGFIPKGYHLIPLPDDFANKTLTLRFTAGEKQAFSVLRTPLLGGMHDLVTQWIRDCRAIIPICVFLVLFGFLLSMLSVFMRTFDENYHVFFGGLVSVNAGLFAVCYFDAFFFITRSLWFTTVTGCLAQFLLPITLIMFLRRITDDDRELQVFNICYLVSGVFFVVAVILQLLRFYPITRSLFYYQRLSLVTCTVLVLFGIRILYRSHLQILRMRDSSVSTAQRVLLTSQATMILAVFVLLFTVLLNTALSQLTRVFSTGASFASIPLLMGLVAYAALMMLSFFYHGVRVTHENDQQKRLTHLAYTDTLTGLPNRAFCMHALRDLDESNEEYCVMSLDVNYLKQTNDTQGHAAGDALLMQFAEELRSSFRASDIIGRLGGDEFIVILKGASLSECLSKAKHMSRNLPFSFSYGCAHSKERSTRYGYGIYRLADQRMYEMKQEIHQNDE